jgi:hypothetical protein
MRPHPEDADWYQPLHVRDAAAARDRIAAQIAAGADVVIAPTWLTHRRALLPLAETRRAAAWTEAAVQVARDAVEVGLERREEALSNAPPDDIRRGRPQPMVAATLPALDDEPEPDGGRLLPSEAATQRDYRDQAGVLADTEPDLLLVEGQRTEDGARTAITEAIGTGLHVWAAPGAGAIAANGLEEWLDWASGSGLERALLPPSPTDIETAAAGQLPWGSLSSDPAAIPDVLDAGGDVVAALNGATVAAVEGCREALDDYERIEVAAARTAERNWLDHVARGAAMAPGGAAVWIGKPPEAPLPGGFEWLVVDATEARQLPVDHFRLAVAAVAVVSIDGSRLLERGGLLVSRSVMASDTSDGVRLISLDDSVDPPCAIYRRVE